MKTEKNTFETNKKKWQDEYKNNVAALDTKTKDIEAREKTVLSDENRLVIAKSKEEQQQRDDDLRSGKRVDISESPRATVLGQTPKVVEKHGSMIKVEDEYGHFMWTSMDGLPAKALEMIIKLFSKPNKQPGTAKNPILANPIIEK
ncbi:MAG: hypothetical protein LBT46_05230 [Planctomycetaceae bacterium]|nr:hypothetical protein [Planctomycetaceae bacterium]